MLRFSHFFMPQSGLTVSFGDKIPLSINPEHPKLDEARKVVETLLKGLAHLNVQDLRQVDEANPLYAKVAELLRTAESKLDELLFGTAHRIEAAMTSVADRGLGGKLTLSAGCILYDGEPVDAELNRRVLQSVNEGFDLTAMVNFCTKLFDNSSRKSIQTLYPFMAKGKMAITPDGNIQVYRVVTPDYYDKHTKSMYNGVGQRVSMPRNKVADDPDEACAAGLHVCSFGYLHTFYSSGDRVLLCEVNPKNVVSVPKDHAFEKMRVCEFEVIADITDQYLRAGECFLSNTSVSTGGVTPFKITGTDENGVYFESGANRLDEALATAKAVVDANGSATVVNTTTGATVFSKTAFEAEDIDDDGEWDDPEDEDEDTADNDGFELLLFRTEEDSRRGWYSVHQIETLYSLDEAKSIAESPRLVSYHEVQVRDKETGAIRYSTLG
jgi:hypothetical protein